MILEGKAYEVRDKLIVEIKKGCISTLVDDITTEEFITNTRRIIDLLDEMENNIVDKWDSKIAIYENPMGSLYYEEVKKED